MAFADDLRQFIENRLQTFDPTIDLSPASPVQVRIIDPIINKLAEDPFTVDIPTFIRDRMVQEFPELAADNGGMLEDMFTDPHQLLLEPFKREIESIKLNQSTQNAGLMSDDQADALGANWFEAREEGKSAGGPIRIFFTAPTTVRVGPEKRAYTNNGRAYFPTESFFITSTQMLFNRQGSLYFMDVVVRAEGPGEKYNIDIGDIVGIDDVPGSVKVTNLVPFQDGSPRETNEEYLGRVETSALTERSLVTKRGILARTSKVFDDILAMQVVGAGEEGMNRDILKGTGEGMLHLVGSGILYGDWLLVSLVTYKDDGPNDDIVIQAGDLVRVQNVDVVADPNRVMFEAKISAVFTANPGTATEKHLLILDQNVSQPFGGHTLAVNVALFKPGYITISGVPGGIAQESTVPSDSVHLGGHTDIFVRPKSDIELQTTLPNITDEAPLMAITDLVITSGSNKVTSASSFVNAGVEGGDLLVIETGEGFAGTYAILDVGAQTGPTVNFLRVDTIFSAAATGLRARVLRSVRVDLIQPRVLKLPFGTILANDLRTVVGLDLFRFDSTDPQSFGALVGDTLEVRDGPDAGKFIITKFDPAGINVDRPATSSGAGLRYEIYAPSAGITLPLVRIKSLEVLDSTQQSTGITVPYGDTVDIRTTGDMEGAGKEIRVLSKDILVFPEAASYWHPSVFSSDPSTAGAGHDARYTQKLVTAEGLTGLASIVRKVAADGANPITEIEVNLPSFTYDGVFNTLLAFTNRKDYNFTADTSAGADHQTSDLAEAKVGDSVTLLDGPNQGSYLIREIHVLDLWGRTSHGHRKVALVKVDPPLKVDPVGTAMRLVDDIGADTPFSGADLLKAIEYATDWNNVSGFWQELTARLQTTFTSLGITITTDELDTLLSSLARTGYSTGPSSRGMARFFFQEPVSCEFFFGDNATFVEVISNPTRRLRVDPDLPPAQVFPESEEGTDAISWNRNGFVENPVPSPNTFSLLHGSPFARRGVRTGDTFEFKPAVNDLVSYGDMESSWMCVTQAGTNIVQLIIPNAAGGLKNLSPVVGGMYFFIDSGPDVGAYIITEVVGHDQLSDVSPAATPVTMFRIDRVLTHSTLAYPTNLNFSAVDLLGGSMKVYTPVGSPTLFTDAGAAVDKYITLYAATSVDILAAGDDRSYLGTFRIVSMGTDIRPFLTIDRSANFADDATANWIIHSEPDTIPADTSGGGKELSDQFVRFRMYGAVSKVGTVNINWASTPNPIQTDPTVSTKQIEVVGADLTSGTTFAHKIPYRVTRPGVRKISSTSMAKRRDGALYYFDLPVIGVGPGQEMNLLADTGLRLAGNYKISGYTLEVEDENFSFSTKERLHIRVPSSVLPVGSTPDLDNEIRLAGQNIQCTYNQAALVEGLQQFFDSPLDRVLVANLLVRHFLPSYFFLDATYVGGSDEDVIAEDIINYVNSISPDDNQIRVDKIVDLFKRRTASSVVLPITLISLTHGTDRKIRGLRSKNAIGTGNIPTFKGVFSQMYFIPGIDTSRMTTRPNGEQVFLRRL